MLAQIEIDTTPSKRALLCRMRTLLSAGTPTMWEQHELRTIDAALNRIDASRSEHCPNCGKRIHV